MYIGLDKILGNRIFNNSEVIAGKNGLKKYVKRISVFDCACDDQLIEQEIIKEGDLFITCLEQFNGENKKKDIHVYVDTLIKSGSAGLLIINVNYPEIFDLEIKNICDEANFPVIWLREDVPYAAVIDTVNKYTTIEAINLINSLKLDKIKYGNISTSEKMNIVYSINPDIKKFVQVIEVKGEYSSELTKTEWHIFYLNQNNDIYVKNKNHMVFILSGDTEKDLKTHTSATLAKFNGIFDSPVIGSSRIHERRDIPFALEEASKALNTAVTMNINTMIYDPMSSLQLLLSIKDATETYDFYNSYVEKLSGHISAENIEEMLLTIDMYVLNKGNFSETAKALNQHENTIRYRINKAKAALGMENDNVRFHETISIASKLRTLLEGKEN